MTAITYPQTRHPNWKMIVIAILVVAIAVALLPNGNGDSAHSGKRGLTVYERARDCIKGKQGRLFYNPSKMRYGLACLDKQGWIVVILDKGMDIVTAIPKEKLTRMEQVIRYMKNAGYFIRHEALGLP